MTAAPTQHLLAATARTFCLRAFLAVAAIGTMEVNALITQATDSLPVEP